MQFTGTSTIYLPNVREFEFSLNGIKVLETGVAYFRFADTGENYFDFTFSGGYIQTDRIIGTYSSIDESNIIGYLSSGTLNYKINDIFHQRQVPFTGLNKITVSAGPLGLFGDISVLSPTINYSLNFSSSYTCYGSLSGSIISDTSFQTDIPSFTFYSSNKPLLTGYSSGIRVRSGVTQILLNDVDSSFTEYANDFNISLQTTFGDVGSRFTSNRTGIAGYSTISLSDSADSVYHNTSLFNGSWSGDSFIYNDNVLNYNINFAYSNTSYFGTDNPSKLIISFLPIFPKDNSGYGAEYITGFNLIETGGYDQTPTFSGAQYYFVTGLQNPYQSLLFSSGCSGALNVTYSGGLPMSSGSGILTLKTVRISGIYGAGVNTFKIVSGYSNISNGSGYQYAPRFVLGTGGDCYSLPDYSGVELSQFKIASGYGAVYAQAAGLTGVVLMDGTGVSGVQVTNVGFGYSESLPPTINFIRKQGDIGTSGASGLFLYKTTGLYDFDKIWTAYAGFGTGMSQLGGVDGGYMGIYDVLGEGNIKIQIICSGLDNTDPVSGVLRVILSGNGDALVGQRIVSQSRYFNLSPYAMSDVPVPVDQFQPLPDLNYAFAQDQFEYQYDGDVGSKIDNIINF